MALITVIEGRGEGGATADAINTAGAPKALKGRGGGKETPQGKMNLRKKLLEENYVIMTEETKGRKETITTG